MVNFANQVTLMPRVHAIVPNFLVSTGHLHIYVSMGCSISVLHKIVRAVKKLRKSIKAIQNQTNN